MAAFDNAELIQDIRDRGSLPSADLRFTDAKLLAAASLELRDVIAPLMVESQTDRMVYVQDVSLVVGQAEYRLPPRALAGRWQSVGWRGTTDTSWQRLRHVSAHAYYLQSEVATGTPYGFYVRDYHLHLQPTPNNAGLIRIPYYQRPNTLVLLANNDYAAVVESVDTATNTLTISGTAPSFFADTLAYDVVRGTPGFECLVSSVRVTSSGSDFVLSGDASTIGSDSVLNIGVQPGDYLCVAGYSPVAQCPVELRGLLATRAARRALKAVNEAQQAAMLDADVAELTEAARSLLAPRADDEPQEFGDPARGLLFGVLRGIGR